MGRPGELPGNSSPRPPVPHLLFTGRNPASLWGPEGVKVGQPGGYRKQGTRRGPSQDHRVTDWTLILRVNRPPVPQVNLTAGVPVHRAVRRGSVWDGLVVVEDGDQDVLGVTGTVDRVGLVVRSSRWVQRNRWLPRAITFHRGLRGL